MPDAPLDLLKAGQGLDSAVAAASQILGNPLFINDIAYNLIATSENRVTDDPFWNEIQENGTFCAETVDFFNDERFIEAFALSESVALMRSEKLPYDRANGKLFDAEGIQIANLLVLACYRPFKEGDFELIEHICDFLSVELQNSEAAAKIGRLFEENLISRLIEGRAPEGVQDEKEMRELYEGLKPHRFALVVDIVQYDRTLTHLGYFRNVFQRIQGEYKYFIYLNNIVVIASTDHPSLDVDRDLPGLRDFFVEHRLYAGVSEGFQDLLALRDCYLQALVALNHGTDGACSEHFFRYEDYKLRGEGAGNA